MIRSRSCHTVRTVRTVIPSYRHTTVPYTPIEMGGGFFQRLNNLILHIFNIKHIPLRFKTILTYYSNNSSVHTASIHTIRYTITENSMCTPWNFDRNNQTFGFLRKNQQLFRKKINRWILQEVLREKLEVLITFWQLTNFDNCQTINRNECIVYYWGVNKGHKG